MTQFASDTFTGANGTTLQAHDANWVLLAGGNNGEIQSNRARPEFAGTSHYTYNTTPPSADYTVAADVIAGSLADLSGVRGRASAVADTGYIARYDGANTRWQLIERVAATDTVLGSFTQSLTLAQSYRLELKMQGNQITLSVDGSPVIGPITNSTLSTAGFPGLELVWSGGAGVAFDNFSADTIAGASILGSYFYRNVAGMGA